MDEERIEFKELNKMVGETWRRLTPIEKLPFEEAAQQEYSRFQVEKRRFEDLEIKYAALHRQAQREGKHPSSKASLLEINLSLSLGLS